MPLSISLLGGACRDSIKVYSWIGGDRPSDVGEAAKKIVDVGFTAVKMNGTEELQYIDSYEKIDQALERIAAVREAVGQYVGIGIDFHGRVHKPMAKILAKELEQFRPMFIEEPVLTENNEALEKLPDIHPSRLLRESECIHVGISKRAGRWLCRYHSA